MLINFFNNSCKVNFKSRLFDLDGTQIKSFDFLSLPKDSDDMAKKGNANTDIFVKKVDSEEKYGEYHNSISYTISNPLFGEQTLTSKDVHTTNRPIVENGSVDTHCLELFVGNVEHMEDKALRKYLLQVIKKSGKRSNVNPVKILNQKLSELESNGGFDAQRISEMTEVAEKLSSDLIKEGAKHINQ